MDAGEEARRSARRSRRRCITRPMRCASPRRSSIPVMPAAAERIRGMLGVPQERWTGLKAGTLAAGTRLGAIEPLFPRIEKTLEELRAMADTATPSPDQTPAASQPRPRLLRRRLLLRRAAADGPATAGPPTDDGISIDDFMKVELRVAKVLEAEAVPKSKKLLKLRVDVGHRAADDRGGHRRGVPARAARRPDDRHRRQPEAGEADGHRVERHGARRQRRGRRADAGVASIADRCRPGHAGSREWSWSRLDRQPLPHRRPGVRRRSRRRSSRARPQPA